MATVNLGRIKPIFKGAYAGGTAYVVDDIVTSGNETFICIQAGTGNATSNASYWTKLAAKGIDGTNGTDLTSTLTTQGDILYRDGSGLQRLAKGTAGKALVMNSGANAPEWGDVGGGLLQIKRAVYTTVGSSFNSTSGAAVTPLAVTITPTAANSSFWINSVMRFSYSNHDTTVKFNVSDSQVGSTTAIFPETTSSGSSAVGNQFFGYGSYASDGNVDNYWLDQGIINGMYTPSSNNANARTFTITARNNTQGTVKWNNTQTNNNMQSASANSWIEVWEIANGIYS